VILKDETYRKRRIRKAWVGLLFILPAELYFLFVYAYPFLETIKMSFFNTKNGAESFVGLSNYISVFSDDLFWKSVMQTLKMMLIAAPVTVVLAMLIAVLMDRLPSIRLRNLLQISTLLPMTVSLIAASLIFSWIFDPSYGIANRVLQSLGIARQGFLTSKTQVIPTLTIITIWIRTGFGATILLAGLQSIPQTYYEAAKIDGASPMKVFFKITLPIMNSQIVLVTITEIIFSAKTFEQVYVTTSGGPVNSSRTLLIHLYETAFKFNHYEEASVIAVFLFVALLVVSAVQWIALRKEVEY
jgi:multiple sugar transport system permease protein